MAERTRPNNIYVTFAEADNRTNWVVDADAVKIFYHTYDFERASRYLKIVEPNIVQFYEENAIFCVYDEDAAEYVRLYFNDVIRLLSLRDRDVTNFSKTLKHRKVNLFTFVNEVLAYKPDNNKAE